MGVIFLAVVLFSQVDDQRQLLGKSYEDWRLFFLDPNRDKPFDAPELKTASKAAKLDLFLRFAQDEDKGIRMFGLTALRQYVTDERIAKQIAPVVAKSLWHDALLVRRTAAQTLTQLGRQAVHSSVEIKTRLDKAPNALERLVLLEAFHSVTGAFPQPHSKYVGTLLNHEDMIVKIEALALLAKTNRPLHEQEWESLGALYNGPDETGATKVVILSLFWKDRDFALRFRSEVVRSLRAEGDRGLYAAMTACLFYDNKLMALKVLDNRLRQTTMTGPRLLIIHSLTFSGTYGIMAIPQLLSLASDTKEHENIRASAWTAVQLILLRFHLDLMSTISAII